MSAIITRTQLCCIGCDNFLTINGEMDCGNLISWDENISGKPPCYEYSARPTPQLILIENCVNHAHSPTQLAQKAGTTIALRMRHELQQSASRSGAIYSLRLGFNNAFNPDDDPITEAFIDGFAVEILKAIQYGTADCEQENV